MLPQLPQNSISEKQETATATSLYSVAIKVTFKLLVGGGLLALISLSKVLDLHFSHTNHQT
jgi:hypothetical protein